MQTCIDYLILVLHLQLSLFSRKMDSLKPFKLRRIPTLSVRIFQRVDDRHNRIGTCLLKATCGSHVPSIQTSSLDTLYWNNLVIYLCKKKLDILQTYDFKIFNNLLFGNPKRRDFKYFKSLNGLKPNTIRNSFAKNMKAMTVVYFFNQFLIKKNNF